MKKRKSQIVLVVLILLLIGITAAFIFWSNREIARLTEEVSEREQSYRYHYAMVVDNYDNPYWDLVFQGAQEAAVEQNAIVEVTGEDLTESYKLAQRLKMTIASKVNGILVAPDGTAQVNELIADAETREIPVLTMMENDISTGRSGYIGINNYEQGQAYGQLLEKLTGEEECHHVVLLASGIGQDDSEANYSSDVLYSSVVEYLNNNDLSDRVTVSRKLINQASIFNCKRDIQILLASEDAPDILICDDYMFTISACQVLVDRNLVGTVQVLGSYISEDILDYIQKGTLYGTVAVDPYELGRTCIGAMTELMEEGRTNDYLPLEMMIIDKSNVRTYRSRFLEVDNE